MKLATLDVENGGRNGNGGIDVAGAMLATFGRDKKLAIETFRRQGMTDDMIAGALGMPVETFVKVEKVTREQDSELIAQRGGHLKFGTVGDDELERAMVTLAFECDNPKIRLDALRYIHNEKLGRNASAAGIQQEMLQGNRSTTVNINIELQKSRKFVSEFASGKRTSDVRKELENSVDV